MLYSFEDALAVANAAKAQIGIPGLMVVGASDLAVIREDALGLTFRARIHPFTKTGKRAGQARVMRVSVVINGMDYWDVKVQRSDGEMHFIAEDVAANELQRLMLALDYDGQEVVNPKYWG